jgi:hypothetical protein
MGTVVQELRSRIFLIRGKRVMLDSDLAVIYGTTSKRLLEQVKRNKKRFPEGFAFQIDAQEFAILRSQIATSSWGGRRYRPFVFTEHGAIMLASVLNTEVAIQASLRVVRAFIYLREILLENKELADKFAQLEKKVSSHDAAIRSLFDAIRRLLQPQEPADLPHRQIGFHVKDAIDRTAPLIGF